MKNEVEKFKGTLAYTTRTGYKSKAEYTVADCMIWDMLHLLTNDELDLVTAAITAQRKLRKSSTAATLEEIGP